MVDAIQMNWTNLKAYNFPSFALLGKVLAKAMGNKCTLILISPGCPSQTWYTQLLCIQDPILIPPKNFRIFGRSEPKPTLIVSELDVGISGMEDLRQQCCRSFSRPKY